MAVRDLFVVEKCLKFVVVMMGTGVLGEEEIAILMSNWIDRVCGKCYICKCLCISMFSTLFLL